VEKPLVTTSCGKCNCYFSESKFYFLIIIFSQEILNMVWSEGAVHGLEYQAASAGAPVPSGPDTPSSQTAGEACGSVTDAPIVWEWTKVCKNQLLLRNKVIQGILWKTETETRRMTGFFKLKCGLYCFNREVCLF